MMNAIAHRFRVMFCGKYRFDPLQPYRVARFFTWAMAKATA